MPNLCLLLLGVLGSYVLLELGSFATLKKKVVVHSESIPREEAGLGFFRQDSDKLPFTIQPNFRQIYRTTEFTTHVATNNEGFRDPRPFLPGQRVDVAVVGDSFTFGMGVEERERYSTRLAQVFGTPNLWNYSWPNGNHPTDYYIFLQNRPELYPRKVLLLGLFYGNDLGADPRAQVLTTDAVGLAVRAKLAAQAPPGLWHIPEKWQSTFAPLVQKLNGSPTVQLARLIWHKYRHGKYVAAGADSPKLKELTALDRGDFDFAALTSLRHTEALARAAEKRGASLVVLGIPEVHRLFPEHPFCPYAQPLCEERARDGLLQKALHKWFASRGIVFVELSSTLLAHGRTAYHHWDGHWTAEGHQAAANAVYRKLSDQDLRL